MKKILFAAGLLLFLSLVDPPPAAHAGDAAFYLRTSAVGQGPQGTLKSGLEVGAGAEYFVRPNLALGTGFGYAREGDRESYADFEITSNVFEVHARFLFADARVRPYAEAGLGWYAMRFRAERIAFSGESWKSDAGGGMLGAGAEASLTGPFALRGGVAYHMIASDVALEGGDLADYVTVGMTLQYRR